MFSASDRIPGSTDLIALLERTLLLSPRVASLQGPQRAVRLPGRDGEAARSLQRLERIELDQSDEIARAKSIYAGGRKEQRRTAAAGAIRRAETALKAARARSRDVTFAVAATRLANARMSGHYAGVETDADGIVALAEERTPRHPRTRPVAS